MIVTGDGSPAENDARVPRVIRRLLIFVALLMNAGLLHLLCCRGVQGDRRAS